MNKLNLISINKGSDPLESDICSFIENFDNATISLTDSHIEISKDDNIILSSLLEKYQEDFMSVTLKGRFSDNTDFRIVKAGGIALELIKENKFTIASMSGSGYAIHFRII